MKKNIKIMILGICLGVVLLTVKIAFHIQEQSFWKYYLIVSGIVIVGIAMFNFCYNYCCQKKMNALVPLLKQGCVEKYIAETEALLCNVKGRFAINLITINLSAGYCEFKQYNKAAELLESLSNEKLAGVLKLVYCVNLCLCYFYQQKNDKAMELYESSQKVFRSYRNHKAYGGNIAVLDIYAAIGRNDYACAAEMLETAKRTWNNAQFLDDYNALEKMLY